MVERTKLTDTHLLNTIARFPKEVLENDSDRGFAICLAIIKYFFGDESRDKFISPLIPSPSYLRQDQSNYRNSQIQSYKIVDLAELLFNLQHTPGFDGCIELMQHGDIEGTYAELDLGRMLFVSSVQFRYVEPQKIKGKDYDVEILLNDKMSVCADAKCKIESTKFSENTIWNTLKSARKQFPVDRPSFIFVKAPHQ